MTDTITTIRNRVRSKVGHMSTDEAKAVIAECRMDGITIFHPAIKQLTGGYNSQSINNWVMRQLGIKAGIIKNRR